MSQADDERTELIVATLTEAFAPLMKADPTAFRAKFRKMAADPFAFYRGTRLPVLRRHDDGRGPPGPTSARAGSGSTATCTPRTSAPT